MFEFIFWGAVFCLPIMIVFYVIMEIADRAVKIAAEKRA
jgi:hypothetical protein